MEQKRRNLVQKIAPYKNHAPSLPPPSNSVALTKNVQTQIIIRRCYQNQTTERGIVRPAHTAVS